MKVTSIKMSEVKKTKFFHNTTWRTPSRTEEARVFEVMSRVSGVRKTQPVK